nr:small acid-soluble spore protein SspI [Aneurinibacillus terranovensis]
MVDIASLDLRAAIIHNMQGSSEEDVRDTIVDAIESKEEKTLPGLGVLFELAWTQYSEQEKRHVTQLISNQLQ